MESNPWEKRLRKLRRKPNPLPSNSLSKLLSAHARRPPFNRWVSGVPLPSGLNKPKGPSRQNSLGWLQNVALRQIGLDEVANNTLSQSPSPDFGRRIALCVQVLVDHLLATGQAPTGRPPGLPNYPIGAKEVTDYTSAVMVWLGRAKPRGKIMAVRAVGVAASRNSARDRWIYDQCVRGIRYKEIIARLKAKPKSWEPITSIAGIKRAAQSYAQRNGLALPAARKKGRPKTEPLRR